VGVEVSVGVGGKGVSLAVGDGVGVSSNVGDAGATVVDMTVGSTRAFNEPQPVANKINTKTDKIKKFFLFIHYSWMKNR